MPATRSAKRLRDHIAHLAYEAESENVEPDIKEQVSEITTIESSKKLKSDSVDIPMSPTLRNAATSFSKTPTKVKSPPKPPPPSFKPPANWEDIYNRLHKFRYESGRPPAAVDVIGCDQLQDRQAPPKDQRFHILVSLLLSSQVIFLFLFINALYQIFWYQTKDPVTADAVRKLHQLGSGKTPWLTVDTVLTTPKEKLNECICKVGFHKKKTDYLRQVASILKEHYDSDIPPTAEEMQQLPGIGPKMAFLAVQAAWGNNEGIGVDTHVHRIASRLRWVPKGTEEKGAEATRVVGSTGVPSHYLLLMTLF